MKFGSMPVGDVVGAILAHSQKAGERTLKKGRVLTADDIRDLASAGLETVVVARLEAGDMGEDAAAAAVAKAATGPHLAASAPFTGRVNLLAEARGVAVLDRGRLDALNRVDEGVTLATVAPYTPVEPRQLVATVKVIPFAVPEAVVRRCVEIARDGEALLRLAPFRAKTAGLIQTTLPGTKASVLDNGATVMAARLEALGGRLTAERRCPHDPGAVAAAIAELAGSGCDMILVSGASAIIDRGDVVPAAIQAAGGRVIHFGMPVDPGNLMLLGRLGVAADAPPVIGLPGCARSPKLNGFDWVLQRLVADLPVGPDEIMAMGAGGFLKDIPSRPHPRARKAAAAPAAAAAPRAPHIAALVLAAGRSRRMGRHNKLLAPVDGAPMVARVVDAAIASVADPITVVTGHQSERVRAALAGRNVTIVHNPDFREGLSASLAAGLSALSPEIDGAVVCLGDMPRVTAAHIDRLVAAFDPEEGRAICVPTFAGKRGNPVLWARRFFAEMGAVAGDVGARHLIGQHGELVCEVEMEDAGVVTDIDSPAALAELTGRRT